MPILGIVASSRYVAPPPPNGGYVAVSNASASKVSTYLFDSGWSTKYADAPTLVASTCMDVQWNPTADQIVISGGTSSTTPRMLGFPWLPGFGTAYSQPSPSREIRGAGFSTTGAEIVAGGGGGLIYGWPWSSSGFGSMYSSPSPALPSGNVFQLDFATDNSAVAVAHGGAPYVFAYAWNVGSGWGTRYSAPASTPSQLQRTVQFNPNGSVLAFGGDGSPYNAIYAWSSAGFGTRYSSASLAWPSYSMAWSPSGDAIGFGMGNNYSFNFYPWSNSTGLGTQYSNPASPISNNGTGLSWNSVGNVVFPGTNTSPHIRAYDWSAAGFGTKYADPSVTPGADATRVNFKSL